MSWLIRALGKIQGKTNRNSIRYGEIQGCINNCKDRKKYITMYKDRKNETRFVMKKMKKKSLTIITTLFVVVVAAKD
jgi:hypothetical protein